MIKDSKCKIIQKACASCDKETTVYSHDKSKEKFTYCKTDSDDTQCVALVSCSECQIFIRKEINSHVFNHFG